MSKRRYYFVKVFTRDGMEYFYDIYIRGSMAAINEAKRQLFNRYNYDEHDVCMVDCIPHA